MDETDVKKPTPQGLGTVGLIAVGVLGFAAILNALLCVTVVRWIVCLAITLGLVFVTLASRKPGV